MAESRQEIEAYLESRREFDWKDVCGEVYVGHLDALVAEVRRLRQERDEAIAERDLRRSRLVLCVNLEKEVHRLREALGDARHQMATLGGLWASDAPSFGSPFRIDLKDTMARIDEALG